MTDLQILVADELAPEGMEILETAGQVTVQKGMDEETLRAALPRYHALVVRSSTVVTARSLELAKNLALIGRAAVDDGCCVVGPALRLIPLHKRV